MILVRIIFFHNVNCIAKEWVVYFRDWSTGFQNVYNFWNWKLCLELPHPFKPLLRNYVSSTTAVCFSWTTLVCQSLNWGHTKESNNVALPRLRWCPSQPDFCCAARKLSIVPHALDFDKINAGPAYLEWGMACRQLKSARTYESPCEAAFPKLNQEGKLKKTFMLHLIFLKLF